MLPSARSLLAAVAIVAVAAISYVVARNTGVFAVRTVEVSGAPPGVAMQVKRALRDDLGTSLLALDMAKARELVAHVPTVAGVSLDRAFPHTLRVEIVPERPVAVVRQGAASWLVSARGRVMATLRHGARPRLPRIWVGRGVDLTVGGHAPAALHDQLAAVTPLGPAKFPARVTSVRAATDELTLTLRSGLQVRLGDTTEMPLKLAVAAKVLHLIPADTRYVDVSVPERPVAGSILPTPTSTLSSSTTTGSSATTGASAAGSSGTGTGTGAAAQQTPTSTHDGAASTLNSQVEVETATSSTP